MKAIRHKPTGLWVIYNPFSGCYDLTSRGIMGLGIYSDNGIKAFCDATGQHSPDELELVEVRIIEDKPVTREVIRNLNPHFGESNYGIAWSRGFCAALDYLGVPVTEEGCV